MFKIEFETINAGIQTAEEISRILKHIGQKVTNNETEGKIRDVNGNSIGSWSWIFPAIDENPEDREKAESLALILENESSFYFGSVKAIIQDHSNRILEGYFFPEQAKQDWFREIIKALRSPSIRKHIGKTNTEIICMTADILAGKYEDEILERVQEVKEAVNRHE